MKSFFFLLFVILFCLSIKGQQKEYIFKNFTQEDGLPSNEAYFVFEDSRHFLWFATDLGVVRYNGSKFEKFNLPDKVIFKIKEDNKGRIWFFSHTAQLAFFENEKMQEYKYNKLIAQRISKINIVDAYIDTNENIFLSSSLDSNYKISNTGIINSFNHIYNDINQSQFAIKSTELKNIFFTENLSRRDFLNQNVPIKITLSDKNKNIIYDIKNLIHSSNYSHFGCIGTNKYYYFFTANFIFQLSPEGSFKLRSLPGPVLCILADKANIRVGTLKNGSFLLDQNLEDLHDSLLTNKSVTSITKDFEGGLWFSTLESGIFYIKNPKIENVKKLSSSDDDNTFRLLNNSDSSLIFAISKGLYNYKNLKTHPLVLMENINVSDLRFHGRKDIFCFGAMNFSSANIKLQTKQIIDPQFGLAFFHNSPNEVIVKNDSIIFATPNFISMVKFSINRKNYQKNKGQVVPTYTGKVIFDKPLKLFLDRNKQIWGGYQDGLYRSSTNIDTFFKIKTSYSTLKKGINCIRQMDNGNLAIGVRFGGVVILNDTNVVINITEENGLLSDKVRYLLPIKDQLWVATAMGISVIKFTSYNPIKFNIINIGKNDGFYNVTINQLIQFKGDIVAATSNGLYFIKDPDELINRKPIPIPFYINSVSYDQNDTSTVQSVDLPYSKSRVLLRYAAVCFNSAEEVKYQYTFSSADTGWITTTSTELLLENLEPGDYDFRIKAIIPNQNRTSDIQHFHITVEKPWWQNNWFRACIIFLFISAGFAFTRYRIKKVQEEEERKTALNSKIAELEQTALRAQMNPHFIFNCLTSIQQLIVTGDKNEANEYLVKFARLIRKTLDLSANPFISIKEEMEYLSEYMFLEQLRITDRFEYEISADEAIDTEKILIPNMMIQPVVENCIRHGIKSLENRKGLIKVHFFIHEKQLVCTVRDNGIGRNKSKTETTELVKHKSYGIDIIEKRLKVFEELNDEPMGIEIKDLFAENGTAEGTEVILQLPYKSIV